MKIATFFLIILLPLSLACTSTKDISTDPEVRFLNVEASVQQTFPGVSGQVHHFIDYTASFDLETKDEVEFLHLLVAETEIPIKSVSVGTKLLNSGELLEEDTKGVHLKATHPVYHKTRDVSISDVLKSPETITVVYRSGKEMGKFEIQEIKEEPKQYRPAAPSGNQD